MSNTEVLESEVLVTDVLLKISRVTEVERAIYDFHLRNAKFLREQIEVAGKPTPAEIMLLFRLVLNFGLSQKALAMWFGVTTGTLSRWVTGENPPREFMRRPIVQRLGEGVDYIIHRLEADGKRPGIKRQPSSAQRGKVVRLHRN